MLIFITAQDTFKCLKIIYLYFCHINQNFNVLLYKSFNKFPSDTKITIKLHRRTHTHTTWAHAHARTQTHTQARMLTYTHKNKMRHS